MFKNLKSGLLVSMLTLSFAVVANEQVEDVVTQQENAVDALNVAQEEEAQDQAALEQGSIDTSALSMNDFDMNEMNPENFDPAAFEAFLSSDEGKKLAEEAEKWVQDMQKNNPKEYEEMMAMTQQMFGYAMMEQESTVAQAETEDVVAPEVSGSTEIPAVA
ncbi:hypothetical protein FJ366_01775 [Candidatus Dependentiae bacterium]|nr:hypothetical protein [Candidatus Dependentiae bacterium]